MHLINSLWAMLPGSRGGGGGKGGSLPQKDVRRRAPVAAAQESIADPAGAIDQEGRGARDVHRSADREKRVHPVRAAQGAILVEGEGEGKRVQAEEPAGA